MDPKSKANFINSVAAGQMVPCRNCGTANRPSDKRCVTCGAELDAPAPAKSAPAFASVAAAPAAKAPVVEQAPVFADGLPAWDILPPQVMVRRH
jgi:hypothetical protein